MKRIILFKTDFNKLKNQVKLNKDEEIIFTSSDDDLNRKVMEKLPVSGIMIPLSDRKDYMRQRDSGFNEVMAKICKKKKLNIYFDFDELFNSEHKERMLARLKQNIILCNREKIYIKVVIGKIKCDKFEIQALFASLNAPTWMLKNLL